MNILVKAVQRYGIETTGEEKRQELANEVGTVRAAACWLGLIATLFRPHTERKDFSNTLVGD